MHEDDYSRCSDEELNNLIKSVKNELERRTQSKEKSSKKTQEPTQYYCGLTIGQEVEDMIIVNLNYEDDTFIGRDNKGIEWVCKIDDYIPKEVYRKKPFPNSNSGGLKIKEGKTLDTKIIPSSPQSKNEKQIDYKMYGTIRYPGELNSAPDKLFFEKKTDVQLKIGHDSPLAKRFEAGLDGLIKELRKKGAVVRHISLEEGSRLILDGQIQGYKFSYNEEADLFEGARITAIVDGTESTGFIVAVMERKIIISVKDDFGANISKCIIRVDNTAMLEALRDRLAQVNKGEIENFNTRLAEDVILNRGQENQGDDISALQEDKLNAKQSEAISRVLANEVFYIWGPPGTGKTKTLSALIRCLFEKGHRILLCSNTNQAVDQVLLKLCDYLGDQFGPLRDGKIIRIGQISHQELEEKWAQYLTVENIVERESNELNTRKNKLEKELERITRPLSNLVHIQKDFKKLDKTLREATECKSNQTKINEKVEIQRSLQRELKDRLKAYKNELVVFSKANLIKRVFLRNETDILNDINKTEEKLSDIVTDVQDLEDNLKNINAKLVEIISTFENLSKKLGSTDRKLIQKQIADIDKEKKPVIDEISEINKKLDNLTKSIVTNAKIVGATVTKSYLSKELFNQFDTVVVDEASMVILPALFYVSGLAKEKVVISGDSFQLSPIIQTDQKEIFEAIGGDVFEVANLMEDSSHRVVMLQEQYRMDDSICRLISSRMYNGALKTADWRIKQGNHLPPEPFDENLIIIDTSSIYPYVNRDSFKSRYNIMNALAVRNLCLYLNQVGFISSNKEVGVCTPYAAQAKVLERVLEGSTLGERVEAGTVHRYQGDEKTVIILDIPDSYGERRVGIFLEADNSHENGAKLFNVAISRAKSQLIVLANLAYLDNKLPKHSFIRGVLADIVTHGKIIDVRSVLALCPIEQDLRKIGLPIKLSQSALETGLFNQREFSDICTTDLLNAKHSILIFSGFITPQRIATYETIFRSKIADGVRIRIVTRPPDCNGNIPIQDGKRALDSLEQWGCVVDTRGSIHEKVVIIDDEIVWFGSLNPLSHTSKTNELMARFSSKGLAQQISSFLALYNREKRDAELSSMLGENPRCLNCGSRSSYRIGKYGAYWSCEECDWKENIFQGNRKKLNDKTLLNNIPVCPECGAEMSLKAGRYGYFYSCSRFPQCKGTIKVNS